MFLKLGFMFGELCRPQEQFKQRPPLTFRRFIFILHKGNEMLGNEALVASVRVMTGALGIFRDASLEMMNCSLITWFMLLLLFSL